MELKGSNMMDPRMVYALYQSSSQDQKEHLAGIAIIERALQGLPDCLPERQLAMEAIMLLDEMKNGKGDM